MGNFFEKNFPQLCIFKMIKRVMGIIFRSVCWGTLPPPPPPGGGSPAVWVNGGAPDAARARAAQRFSGVA